MSGYIDKNVKKFCIRLGFRIRELRLKNKLSQESLAKKSQVSRSSITQIEGGVQNPTLFNVLKIAKVLKVPIDDLIKDF